MMVAYRQLWRFGTTQVERRFGWLVPVALAPGVFVVLSAIQEIVTGVDVLKQMVGYGLVAILSWPGACSGLSRSPCGEATRPGWDVAAQR